MVEHRTKWVKNQTVTVTIEDMGVNGEGIGKIDGYPLFIKDAVIGDVAEVIVTKTGKSFGFGHLSKILTPSPKRCTPRCPVAKACGGCQLQAVSPDAQLTYKEKKVRENLRRLGAFSKEELAEKSMPIIGMENPWHYRNKEQFPVGYDREGRVTAGFYAGRSHRLIPVTDCMLAFPQNKDIIEIALEHVEKHHVSLYDEKTGKGFLRHIVTRCGYHSGEWMVTFVGNAKDPAPLKAEKGLLESLQALPGMTSICFSPNQSSGNVILGTSYEVLYGKETISDTILGVAYEISPLSFFQVNPIQTEKLYQTALDFAALSGKETVWDLYCGIGTMSLLFAKQAKHVIGVEIVPQAVRDAEKNAERNNIQNAEFFAGKAEEVAECLYRACPEKKADIVVVDPPRKGCDAKLLSTILDMAPQRIVYVSCDSATLARDLKILCENGYRLEKYRPCDMFPQTCHVETVVLLSKEK